MDSSEQVTSVFTLKELEQRAALQEGFPLKDMTPEMFQQPIVKKLLLWTKAIGNIGSNASIPGGDLDAAQIVEKIKSCAGAGQKFAQLTEILLNRVLAGKISEDEISLTEEHLLTGLQSWLYFGLQFNKFQKNLEPKTAVRTLIDEKVFGEDKDKAVQKLMSTAISSEARGLVITVGKDFLNPETKREIVVKETEAKGEFTELWNEGKKKPTPVPPATERSATAEAPAETSHEPSKEKPAQPEKVRITSVQLAVTFIGQGPDQQVHEITTMKDGGQQSPVVTPGKPLLIYDEQTEHGQPTSPVASIQIEDGKVVLYRTGDKDIFDYKNGLPVFKIEIREGAKNTLKIGDTDYEIKVVGIGRETVQSRDSHPTIETRESMIHTFPAVLCVDADGQIISAYPCFGEKDRVVKIGTDPSNDIVLPQGKSYQKFNAEFLFLPGKKIFIRAGKEAALKFQNRPSGFVTSQAVKFDENEDVIAMGMNGDTLLFVARNDHPLSDADIRAFFQGKISRFAASLKEKSYDLPSITRLESEIIELNKTIEGFEDSIDLTATALAANQLIEEVTAATEAVAEEKRKEYEAKMAKRRHFNEGAGETAETPRPYKYPALVDKIEKDKSGKRILHLIFPPGLSMGKDKVNMLEAHAPQNERLSKYGVQDFECSFVLEDASNVRLVIEPRVLKNSAIKINEQIPGTRDGKTHELDMLRAPLKDGDDIQIGLDRYAFEPDHEFTKEALKPYVAAYLKEIMEVLVLYPDHGDKGDRKHAQESLAHFKDKRLVSEQQIKEVQAIFEKEKLAREVTSMTGAVIDQIREVDEELVIYTTSDQHLAGFPYDAELFNAGLALANEPEVRWEETGWTRDTYLQELSRSAIIRVHAYDKKLFDLRQKLLQPNYSQRFKTVFSNQAEEEYKNEQESLQRSFRKVLVEIVSLLKPELAEKDFHPGWLGTRLTTEQYPAVEEISAAQNIVASIEKGVGINAAEVRNLVDASQQKTCAEFLSFRNPEEQIAKVAMADYVLAKMKERAKAMFEQAGHGENISATLDQLEEFIAHGLVNHADIGSSPELFADLRTNEDYLNQVKAGKQALKVLMSSSETNIEDILEFSKRWLNEEFDLEDEDEENFKEYCREGLASAMNEARTGTMTSYIAILAKTAVRLKIVKPTDVAATPEELEKLHETAERTREMAEMRQMIEDVKTSNVYNLHPLLKLKKYLESRNQLSPADQNVTDLSPNILSKLVEDRLGMMFEQARGGEDPGLLQMVVEDMQQYGFANEIKKCVADMLADAIDAVYEETRTVEEVRPFIMALHLIGLWESMEEVREDVVNEHLTKSFDDPGMEVGKRVEKLGENLRLLGLYD